MKRVVYAIILSIAAGALSGCVSVLVPEHTIKAIPPAGARDSLQKAVEYSDTALSQFDSVSQDLTITEASLSVLTLGAGTVLGYDVIFARAAQTLRAPAVTVGFLKGVELISAGPTRRQILDTGSLAVSCARQTAYEMDALGTTSRAGTPPAPRSPAALAGLAARTNNSIGVGSDTALRLRQLAQTLRNVPSIQTPEAAGAGGTRNAASDAVADVVTRQAAKQQAAADEVSNQGAAAQLSAKDYLVNTVEMIVRETLQQLHSSAPSLDKIASIARDQSQTYLTPAKQAVDKAVATTDASKEVAAAVAPMAKVAIVSDLQGQVNVVASHAIEGPPLDGFDGRHTTAPRMSIPAPVAAAKQDASAKADEGASNVEAATDGAQSAANSDSATLTEVKNKLDAIAKCSKS